MHVNGGSYRKISVEEWRSLGGDDNKFCDWHEGIGYVVYDDQAREQYRAKIEAVADPLFGDISEEEIAVVESHFSRSSRSDSSPTPISPLPQVKQSTTLWEDLRADVAPEMPMVIEAVRQSRARRGLVDRTPHPDDLAVDRFAVAVKAKLAQKRAESQGELEKPHGKATAQDGNAGFQSALAEVINADLASAFSGTQPATVMMGEIWRDGLGRATPKPAHADAVLEDETSPAPIAVSEPVAWRARKSEQENWYLFDHPVGWWECQPLYEPPASVPKAVVETSFIIEWIAAARPPVHPNPMTGRATFSSFKRALRHMESQASDAQFVSLTSRTSVTTFVERSDDLRAALALSEDRS